jgi:hypothetical protein
MLGMNTRVEFLSASCLFVSVPPLSSRSDCSQGGLNFRLHYRENIECKRRREGFAIRWAQAARLFAPLGVGKGRPPRLWLWSPARETKEENTK